MRWPHKLRVRVSCCELRSPCGCYLTETEIREKCSELKRTRAPVEFAHCQDNPLADATPSELGFKMEVLL